MRRSLPIIAALAMSACSPAVDNNTQPANGQVPLVDNSNDPIPVMPVLFKAADGVTVYGTYYRTHRPKAMILLFHQAGSSKDEYATIAPRLNAAGYNALAIDQRSGGPLFGKNETAALLGKPADYLSAKADLQAAIDWAPKDDLPMVLWGSSYSSSLVFPVADENSGRVKAILAFSPGEYFDDKTLVARAAAKVGVPVYVTVSSAPQEAAAAKPIVDAIRGDKTFYVPKAGIHGSSTLIEAKDPNGAVANWKAVLAFLAKSFH